MPTNKNALLRYQILDRCFSNRHRKYTIEDLVDAVNEALYDMYGSEVSVRQIRDDIKYMRDRVSYDAPIEAIPFDGKRCYYRYTDPDYAWALPWRCKQMAGGSYIEPRISFWHQD